MSINIYDIDQGYWGCVRKKHANRLWNGMGSTGRVERGRETGGKGMNKSNICFEATRDEKRERKEKEGKIPNEDIDR